MTVNLSPRLTRIAGALVLAALAAVATGPHGRAQTTGSSKAGTGPAPQSADTLKATADAAGVNCKQLEERAKAGNTELDDLDKKIGALGAIMDAVEKDKPSPTTTPRQEPEHRPPKVVVENARRATQGAREYATWARQAYVQAQGELARARAAPNPAVALDAYRRAEDGFRQHARFIEQARRVIDGAAPTPAQNPPRGGLQFGMEGDTLRRLRTMADDLARQPNSQTGILLRNYDSQRTGAAVPPRRPPMVITPQSEIQHYDPAAQQLKLVGGQTINVRPLAQAVGQRPLFVPVPSPTGGDPVLRLDPAIQRTLRSASGREELRRIGGVALDVTFSTLDIAGVPDFVGRPGRTVVEQPVLLSLRQLIEELEAYAGDAARWSRLPDRLRYPAQFARLHGFVHVPERQDIVLVGTSGTAADRLDVDSLILLLRVTWRDGLVPAVSLDPVPGNIAGPQYSRVINLPADSTAARIMLDADYAMKRILFGSLKPRDPAYRSLASLYAEQPPARQATGRFWLTPVPLSQGAIVVSADGSVVLTDAGVEARTEELSTSSLHPLGRTTPARERAAAEFTRILESLKTDSAVAPGLYQRLQGLVDIVTLGALLRQQSPSSPLIDRLVALPYRRLTSGEAAPASYPGITVSFPTQGGRGGLFGLSGGVEMLARPRQRAVDTYQDALIVALRAKAGEPFDRQLDRRLAFPISFPALTQQPAEREAASRALQGRRLLAQGDLPGAQTAFRAALSAVPDWTEAWLGLAATEIQARRFVQASEALRKARSLDLADAELEAAELDLALAQNPQLDASTFDPRLARELSRTYVERAFLALGGGQLGIAKTWAERAADLDPENHSALIARALSLISDRSDDARQASQEGVRLLRRAHARDRAANEITRNFAFVLALDAALRIGALSPVAMLLADPVPNDGAVRAVAEDLLQSAEQAQEALKLAPQLGFARFVELYARIIRVGLLKKAGQAVDLGNLRRAANGALGDFPTMTAHFTYIAAQLDGIDGQPQAMLQTLDRAIAADASFTEALFARTIVLATSRQCPQARTDLARLGQLAAHVPPEIARHVERCGS